MNLLKITDKFKSLDYFSLDHGEIKLVDDTYGKVIDINNETKDYVHLKSKETIKLKAGTYCFSFLGKGIWTDAYVMVNNEWELLKTDWQRFSTVIKLKQDTEFSLAITVSGNTRVHVTQFQIEEGDKFTNFESGSGEDIPTPKPTPMPTPTPKPTPVGDLVEIVKDGNYEKALLVSNRENNIETLMGETDINLQANQSYVFSYYAKSDYDCIININKQDKTISSDGKEDYITFTPKQNEKFKLVIKIKDNHKIKFANFEINEGDKLIKIGRVIIEYVDYESGAEVKETETITGEVGTNFNIQEKEIAGYKFNCTYNNLTGKFTEIDQKIYLYYVGEKEVVHMGIATAQFTITDLNDAITLEGFINSNHPKAQMYNPDTNGYVPDWSKSNLVLTPSLYKIGTMQDVITSANVQSVRWFQLDGDKEAQISNNGDYALSGQKGHILTVKNNILAGLPAKDFICEIIYRDDASGLTLTKKTGITFSRVTNGGGITAALAFAPRGNLFKNNQVHNLMATCDLWRGSLTDTTNVLYQWYVQEPSAKDEGAGAGWKKLTQSDNRGITGYNTREINIPDSAVNSFEVFKCGITDTDSASNTYKQTFWDTISFIDNSDPIIVSVNSTGGDKFKNGIGSTTLIARVFQAGAEIDTEGKKYTYRWTKWDKEGNLDRTFGDNGYKDGKKITVGSDDVYIKATFEVDLI